MDVKLWRPEAGEPSFFSSARSFAPPVGTRFEPGSINGYYIDLRLKANHDSWPPPWLPRREDLLYVALCQWALGCYERFLAGEGERWLAAARGAADYLLETQESDGVLAGGWLHRFDMAHTFPLKAPWLSSMAQGQGASLLVRIHAETGEDAYAAGALQALGPLSVPSVRGGVAAQLRLRPFYEEYPTSPPSFVLNGFIFTLWGCYDTGIGLRDHAATQLFRSGAETLAANMSEWDTGYWSLYDLYPHPVPNVSSSAYHLLHIRQLTAIQMLLPDVRVERVRTRFERYFEQRHNRLRGFAAKARFRLRVPRGRPAVDDPSSLGSKWR